MFDGCGGGGKKEWAWGRRESGERLTDLKGHEKSSSKKCYRYHFNEMVFTTI